MLVLFQYAVAGFTRAPFLWTGTLVISVLLIFTLITRWGRTQPLGRCILLSLLGHLWLAACSTTVLMPDRAGPRGESIIAISTLPLDLEAQAEAETPQPMAVEPVEPIEPPMPDPMPVEPQPKPAEPAVEAAPVKAPAQPAAADVLIATAEPAEAAPLAASDDLPVPLESDEPLPEGPPEPQPAPQPVATAPTPEPPLAAAPPERPELPEVYQGRIEPDRAKLVAQAGGDERTEAAVQAALAWLAANQSDDGRWDARRHGAGRELLVNGRDRAGAGAKADTGVTGLALLAFLGAGHTHKHGDHQRTVAAAVSWLVRSMGSDGNLGGEAEVYSFMYCHGMAAYALAECYVLTRDPALEEPVRRAMGYIVRAQHPVTGGWRYRPGDRGDTSVFGWQLMALKSGEAAGIAIPTTAREGMVRFLQSVGRGRFGGLASYRPGEVETRPMTAEALASRQFLGMLRSNPAAVEAGDYVLGELPRADRANYYYWYYGTLAMHQLGGQHWETWNRALARTLVDTQVTTGNLAGTWAPTDAWGGHGGRVYSTALAALSLEAYYRFLPPQAVAGQQHNARDAR